MAEAGSSSSIEDGKIPSIIRADGGTPPQKRMQRKLSIKVMDKIYEVSKGKIPQHLLEDLTRDFTDAEKEEIYARVGRTLAPRCTFGKPKVRAAQNWPNAW
eukprot:3297455-Prymnesium_polylepis.1